MQIISWNSQNKIELWIWLKLLIAVTASFLTAQGCMLVGEIPSNPSITNSSEVLAQALINSEDNVSNIPSASGASSIFVVTRTSARGLIASLSPSTTRTQSFNIEVSDTHVIATLNVSEADFSSNQVALPQSSFSVIGASFSEDPTHLDLTVNGKLAQPPNLSGSPSGAVQTTRRPYVLSSGVETAVFFKRNLNRSEHSAVISYLAQKYNVPIILDPNLKIPADSISDPNFAPAQNIIQARCQSCHSAWSGISASYYFNNGLVFKGSPETSPIYYRLNGSTGILGPKTMPTLGPLSNAEIMLIKNWIANAP